MIMGLVEVAPARGIVHATPRLLTFDELIVEVNVARVDS